MKKYIAALVVSLALCGLATAAQTIQTETFSGTPNLTRTFTFDQFDDMGGSLTLLSIQVLVDLDVSGGSLTLDNDGEGAASGAFEFGAKGDISSSDVPLLDGSFQPVTAEVQALTTGAFALDPNIGDGAGDFDSSGPDGMLINGGLVNDSDSGFIASALFAQYTGLGTFDVDIDVTQWTDFGGVSGIEYAVTPMSASGDVTVIYNYIPEPATMSLLGLGALALIRRKRK